jgi:AcrR family transcriptional regulator
MASLPEHLSAAAIGEPLPREVVLAGQRRRVIDGATAVFARRGYAGATVEQLVAGSGVAVGSFYELFDGKEECFLAAFDLAVDAGRARVAEAIPAAAPFAEQVWAALGALVELIAADPAAARLALVEAQSAGPAALARHEALLDEAAAALRHGRATSPLAADLPPSLEDSVVGGIFWLLRRRLAIGDVEAIGGLLPELAKIIFDPYLGEDEAARALAAHSAA